MSLNTLKTYESSEGRTVYEVQLKRNVTDWPCESAITKLSAVGITCQLNTENGVSTITGPTDQALFLDGLATLTQQELHTLRHPLIGATKTLVPFVRDLQELKRLELYCLCPEPRYPHGGIQGKPFTLPFDDRLHARFDRLRDLLRVHGVTMQMGAEFEFSILNPIENFKNPIEELALSILEDEARAIDTALQTRNRTAFIRHQQRAQKMKSFFACDFLMLHWLEREAVTKDVFEYAFGREIGGAGYYDNDFVQELRTKTLDGDDFFDLYLPAQRRVLEDILKYRMPSFDGRQHLSLSFWRDGRNILLCETPEDAALTKQIITNLGYAMENGQSLILPSRFLNNDIGTDNIIGPSRLTFIRHAHSRLEFRSFSYDAQHIVLGAILGAGAALAAIDPGFAPDTMDKHKNIIAHQLPGISFPDNSVPWLRHAIQASTIDPDTGALIPDMMYLQISATKILHQINPDDPEFQKQSTGQRQERSMYEVPHNPDHHIQCVRDMIALGKAVQNDDGQWTLQWPDQEFKLSDRTTIKLSAFNEGIECLGVSTRFSYRRSDDIQTVGGNAQNIRDNGVLNAIFNSDLSMTWPTC